MVEVYIYFANMYTDPLINFIAKSQAAGWKNALSLLASVCRLWSPAKHSAWRLPLTSVLSSWPAAVTCVAQQPGQLPVKRTFDFLCTHFKHQTVAYLKDWTLESLLQCVGPVEVELKERKL